jgi:hypothetical protein
VSTPYSERPCYQSFFLEYAQALNYEMDFSWKKSQGFSFF